MGCWTRPRSSTIDLVDQVHRLAEVPKPKAPERPQASPELAVAEGEREAPYVAAVLKNIEAAKKALEEDRRSLERCLEQRRSSEEPERKRLKADEDAVPAGGVAAVPACRRRIRGKRPPPDGQGDVELAKRHRPR